MKFLIALLFLLASTHSFLLIKPKNLTEHPNYKTCTENDGQNIEVTDVQFDNGVKGETCHFIVKGTALNDLHTSEVKVVISKTDVSLPIPVQHFKWANEYSAGDDILFDFSQYMPTIIPSGDYNFDFHFMGKDGESLDCINFHHDF